MNVYDELGFRVILDYGHNPHAVEAMCNLVDKMNEGTGMRTKRVVVLACPGDRRDEDARAIAARASCSFDVFVCREDDDLRGRAPGEMAGAMRNALVESGVQASRIHVVPGEADAVDFALRSCRSGDFLLVFGDQLTRCWKQIIYFGREHDGANLHPEVAAWRPAPAPPVVETVALPQGHVVVDERGARLARDPEPAD